jgi:hypothetical protein
MLAGVEVGKDITVAFPAYERLTALTVYAISANGTYDPLVSTLKESWTVVPVGKSTLFHPHD